MPEVSAQAKLVCRFLQECTFVDIPAECVARGWWAPGPIPQGHKHACFDEEGVLLATAATPDELELAAVLKVTLDLREQHEALSDQLDAVRKVARLLREL